MVAIVEQEIWIDAPVDVVWRTVTEPELVTRWFAEQVDVAPTPGSDGTLTLGRTAPSRTVRVTVQSVDRQSSFSYRWLHPEGAPARTGNSVLVTFTLTAEHDGTRLRVVETELDAMGWSRDELDGYVNEHTAGWAAHLGRLRGQLVGQRP
ncbi:SRPBCC domain-containing protein [Actinomycetospora endophytica]|uniref:SRPBCC domain-containing protein n=1 Tax=Actinomycetospora endophytica TaxID=2291215 RepID=A0ABS8P0N4_9PSEU|nr:SRPBCC domain-containing protein [Actinomycetospora endophytica]MCD2191817.1 SRPBCC domain-containing protein [Actinomycetospora endophytica]